ncbi:alpha-hydroxy-acid oxidizing protein [Archangium minus]|uniref:Alpha-hydroxy-acid oxidizing protein n=1 Tax=Archangium minus TaxID=83450 RepID=A0ABY9WS65_9BACT|nr:alpha-hydroxy-acid oxidizing protein [Archangium violaceum]WNG46024.1 alpha-hydroxy-acid oxidizing protein [Archangium minus]
MKALSLRELEAEAQRRLEPGAYDLFAGGADDEVTLRANENAFARLGLVPRVLRGRGRPQLETTLLGCRTSMPIVIAPTAFHRLAHPDGERATARAAAAAGAIMTVSMASTTAIEEIAEASAGGTLWFQLYLQPDLGFTEALIRRVEAAGCKALVVTVDSPVFGRRERDLRNGFTDLPSGLCCENMRPAGPGGTRGPARPIAFSEALSWEHIDWLRKSTSLPLVLKGLVHPADAKMALERGVDAVLVSNHGGRQLDTIPATLELLPPIAEAIGGRLPILLDGGIRRGTDIVKALALGANAVAIGRPVLWGLAAEGEAGVAHVLETLRSELERAMALCGCGSASDVGPELLHVSRWEKQCRTS